MMRFVLPAALCWVVWPTMVLASEPIVIEMSRGRNLQAADLAEKADKEVSKGDLVNARRDVDQAMRWDPTYWPSLFTRAKLFARERQWQRVIDDCSAGLKQAPIFFEFAILRAQANAALGRCAAALAELNHVIGIHPPRIEPLAEAFSQRAWLRVTCKDASIRNPQQAISDAERACKLMHWNEADQIDTLAAAYADAGDFASATRYEEQAMKAPDANQMSSSLQQHLALFAHHRKISP
jgi:hypothetical protein